MKNTFIQGKAPSERLPDDYSSLPHASLLFIIALATTTLLSQYGTPSAFFGWLIATLAIWIAYRLTTSSGARLILGILLISICLIQILFNRDGQIYVLLVVTVDVLFPFSERLTIGTVLGEIIVFAIYRFYTNSSTNSVLRTAQSLSDLVPVMTIPLLVAIILLFYVHTVHELVAKTKKLAQQTLVIESMTLSQERARMASDMHDSLGQYLSAIHLHEEAIRQMTDKKDIRIQRQFDSLEQITEEALGQIRQRARALNPAAFGDELTKESIHAFAESFKSTGLRVSAEVNGNLTYLPIVVKTLLYRALQETLTNVVRHAKATKAKIEINVSADIVTLIVSDNGIGLKSTNSVPTGHDASHSNNKKEVNELLGKGYGLSSLSTRICAMKGRLILMQDAEMHGAKIVVELPLN